MVMRQSMGFPLPLLSVTFSQAQWRARDSTPWGGGGEAGC